MCGNANLFPVHVYLFIINVQLLILQPCESLSPDLFTVQLRMSAKLIFVVC